MTDEYRRLYGEFLATRIKATAAGYRAVADKLDAIAAEVPLLGAPGHVDASSLAQRAMHEVMWGAANASPDAIVTAAADYDRNVTQAKTQVL